MAKEKENDTQFSFANQPPHLHPHTHSCFSSLFLFPLGNIPLTTISVLGTRKGVSCLEKGIFPSASALPFFSYLPAHQEARPCCTSMTSHSSHQLFGDPNHSLNSSGNTLLSPLDFIFFCRCSDETQLQVPSGSGIKCLPLDTHFKATPMQLNSNTASQV